MHRLTVVVATLVTIVTMTASPAAQAKDKAAPQKESIGNCAELRSKGQTMAAAGVTKAACARQDSAGARKPSANGAPCTANSDQRWTVGGRFVACRETSITIDIFTVPSFILIGQIFLWEVQNITTSTNSATWTHEYNLQFRGAWGQIGGAMIDGGFFDCDGQCFPIASNFPMARLDARSNLMAFGQMAGDPGPQGITQGSSTVTWTFSQPGVAGFSFHRAGAPEVRCDGFFGIFGCVFPNTFSILVVDGADPRITEYARHVAQGLSSTGHGTFPFNPLTKTMSDVQNRANRQIACPPRRINPPGKSCDEYPFASTLQGAAAFPGGGRTFPGCLLEARLPIGVTGPGWSACMINDRHNSTGGGLLSLFYRTQRVIDGDQFFVFAINV